ncbi:8960_t:CDS:2 [Entrophospora sp. SA101]|nr:8960_t:CDS:2 [Entrophospora sp. SA101]
MSTFNYEKKTFHEIVQLLIKTIGNTDTREQTVLHHVAIFSNLKNKKEPARYYMEVLLSDLNQFPSSNEEYRKNIINKQNIDGDTAIIMLAKSKNEDLVKLLFNAGGDPYISNKENKNVKTNNNFVNTPTSLGSTLHLPEPTTVMNRLPPPLINNFLPVTDERKERVKKLIAIIKEKIEKQSKERLDVLIAEEMKKISLSNESNTSLISERKNEEELHQALENIINERDQLINKLVEMKTSPKASTLPYKWVFNSILKENVFVDKNNSN